MSYSFLSHGNSDVEDDIGLRANCARAARWDGGEIDGRVGHERFRVVDTWLVVNVDAIKS